MILWQPTLSPDVTVGVGKPVPIPDPEKIGEYKLKEMKNSKSFKINTAKYSYLNTQFSYYQKSFETGVMVSMICMCCCCSCIC